MPIRKKKQSSILESLAGFKEMENTSLVLRGQIELY